MGCRREAVRSSDRVAVVAQRGRKALSPCPAWENRDREGTAPIRTVRCSGPIEAPAATSSCRGPTSPGPHKKQTMLPLPCCPGLERLPELVPPSQSRICWGLSHLPGAGLLGNTMSAFFNGPACQTSPVCNPRPEPVSGNPGFLEEGAAHSSFSRAGELGSHLSQPALETKHSGAARSRNRQGKLPRVPP